MTIALFVIMIPFTKKNKWRGLQSNKLSILVIMIAAIMSASTMVTVAHAAPILSVRGGGTGTFVCGDGSTHTSSILQIDAGQAFRTQGPSHKLGGQWSVLNHEVNNGDGGFVSGIFYGGKMGKTSFNLLGIFQHVEGLCDNDSLPAKGTITGQCGLGAKIDVRFENGAHGTFTGSVNCL
jgi:hypothetical protein